jgi:murein DD-endopeptidase MepM/ murein hydrolase activator NlpD
MASAGPFLRLSLLLALAGCAALRPAPAPLHPDAPRGSWYVPQAGETLAQIAARTGVPQEDLLEINGLRRDQPLEPGRPIFLLEPSAPPNERPVPERPLSERPHGVAASLGSAGPLRWPLAAPRLSSAFGARQGHVHEGIDLAAPTGTAIRAADSGQVLYAGDAVRGYGNMVVLQHGGDLMTVYAHGSVLLVRTGDKVSAGQEIARVGQSGRATAPHLHFEVRRGQVPQDPLQFLPELPAAGQK